MVRRPSENNVRAVLGPMPYIEAKAESDRNRVEAKMASMFQEIMVSAQGPVHQINFAYYFPRYVLIQCILRSGQNMPCTSTNCSSVVIRRTKDNFLGPI